MSPASHNGAFPIKPARRRLASLHTQRSNRRTAGRETHPSSQLGKNDDHAACETVRKNRCNRSKQVRQTSAFRQLDANRTRTPGSRGRLFLIRVCAPAIFNFVIFPRVLPCVTVTTTFTRDRQSVRAGVTVQHASQRPAEKLESDYQQRCISAAHAHAGQSFVRRITVGGRPVAHFILQDSAPESSKCDGNSGFEANLSRSNGNAFFLCILYANMYELHVPKCSLLRMLPATVEPRRRSHPSPCATTADSTVIPCTTGASRSDRAASRPGSSCRDNRNCSMPRSTSPDRSNRTATL